MECIKCDLCDIACESRGSYLDHLETHDGTTLSCRLCHKTFRNKYLFLYHKEASMCEQKISSSQIISSSSKSGNKKKVSLQVKKTKIPNLKQCTQCNMTFQFQRHYIKHLEGHKRNNCKYCTALFTNRKELIAHVSEEHKIKIPEADYQCKFCDKKFGKRRILYKHYIDHANGQWVCALCGKFLQTEEEHASHQENHQQSKQWNCERCHESFARRQQYLIHMKDHEKYQCRDCGESFASKSKYRDHKQTVHDIRCVERRHQCSECGQRFSRPTLLMLHFRIHTGEKPHECKECGKRYHTPKGYAQHLHSSAHRKPDIQKSFLKKLKCSDCDLEFATKHLLDRHVLRFHKREISFKCEYCEQRFNCKENMKRHLALHTEERQFVCEQCAAAFHSLNALKDHISYVHSQVREFVCAKCGMSFKRNSGLNRHMASHSEDRPFVCDCGNTYKRSSHLRRHKETVHGEILKSQKLVRLKQDESGAFVPVEGAQQTKEGKKKKKKLQASEQQLQKSSSEDEKPLEASELVPISALQNLHLPPPIPPPPPAPPPAPSSASLPSSIPSPLPPSEVSTLSSTAKSALSPLPTSVCLTSKVKSEPIAAILPLVDAAEVEQFQELCGSDTIINGNINLDSDELTVVTGSNEISETDESQTSAFSGNILHTIVSYNMSDFPSSLSSVPNAESQLVFTSSVPVSSINIDQSHTVLTLTFDPLMESDSAMKSSDSFQQEKGSDREGESSLLLDPSVSSHLALDSIPDPLYIPNVAMDRASTLITSTDTVLSGNAIPLSSDDTSLGGALVSSSDTSTMGNNSALFNSVDTTFGTLQHSEVLMNMQSHIDSHNSVSPYSLSSNLNISVSDCESLLSSQNNHSRASPPMILSHETEESIGLDSGNAIAILPDYLHPNFSFLNV